MGDYAEVVRQLRNLTHPGRYAVDHRRRRVTDAHAKLAGDTINAVLDTLLAKIGAHLAELAHADGDR